MRPIEYYRRTHNQNYLVSKRLKVMRVKALKALERWGLTTSTLDPDRTVDTVPQVTLYNQNPQVPPLIFTVNDVADFRKRTLKLYAPWWDANDQEIHQTASLGDEGAPVMKLQPIAGSTAQNQREDTRFHLSAIHGGSFIDYISLTRNFPQVDQNVPVPTIYHPFICESSNLDPRHDALTNSYPSLLHWSDGLKYLGTNLLMSNRHRKMSEMSPASEYLPYHSSTILI